MFKIFWVSDDHDEHSKDHLEVETHHWHEEEHEEEVWQVALDILETHDCVYIVAPIAWVKLEEIDLSINKTVLTIKGSREKPHEYDIDWVNIRNTECFWWKFVRNIILPENLSFNNIKAYMEDNLLIITIPKLKFDTKNIKINRIEN